MKTILAANLAQTQNLAQGLWAAFRRPCAQNTTGFQPAKALKYHTSAFIMLCLSLTVSVLSAIAQTTPPDSLSDQRLASHQPLGRKARNLIAEADREYAYFAYTSAAALYEKALKKAPGNKTVKRQLARCYHHLNDSRSTAYWYQQIENHTDWMTEEDQLYYARALESNQEYADAQVWYEAYRKGGSSKSLAQAKLAALKQLEQFYQDSALYEIAPLAINTPESDFAPTYWQDGIVFASSRSEGASGKTYGWYEQPFLDLFYASLSDSGQSAAPVRLQGVNSKLHEGPAAFYDQGRKMIFTRNNYYEKKKGKSEEGVVKLKLFTAERADTSNANWINVQPFRYNDAEYSVGHPTVSQDGKRLYFASDMPGGEGGTDLYVCRWDGRDWSQPKNLGPDINTKGDDLFPFVHPSGHLYFASNGRGGLGGLDIYRASTSGDSVRVHNLGYPINSSQDDFGFVADASENAGFFSTNRNGEPGNDDIYRFRYTPPQDLHVDGYVLSTWDSMPLPSSLVALSASKTDTVSLQTDSTGAFSFVLAWDQDYRIDAEKHGFSEASTSLSTQRGEARTDSVLLYLTPYLLVQGTATDKQSGEILPGTKIVLEDTATQQRQEAVTSANGRYEFKLNPDRGYHLKASKQQYLGDQEHFGTLDTMGILTVNTELEKLEEGKTIRLDIIYYDFDKWNIREDAARELDQLVQALRDNPSMQIEMSSHTDVRGNDAYNLYLSTKRAYSAAAYLIESGINEARITRKGYGETKLVNECENGVQCSEEKHQENRRTEFTITGLKAGEIKVGK